jgi:hypothetical protein
VLDVLRAHVATLEKGSTRETLQGRVVDLLTKRGPLTSAQIESRLPKVSMHVLAEMLIRLKREGLIVQDRKGRPWHLTSKVRANPIVMSELLFPSPLRTGGVGMMSRSALDKLFALVCSQMQLGFALTPKGSGGRTRTCVVQLASRTTCSGSSAGRTGGG